MGTDDWLGHPPANEGLGEQQGDGSTSGDAGSGAEGVPLPEGHESGQQQQQQGSRWGSWRSHSSGGPASGGQENAGVNAGSVGGVNAGSGMGGGVGSSEELPVLGRDPSRGRGDGRGAAGREGNRDAARGVGQEELPVLGRDPGRY